MSEETINVLPLPSPDKDIAEAGLRVPTVRISPDNQTVFDNLGLLAELAGKWHGCGFNLIARPNREGNANLYLQINTTVEDLTVTPIGSDIPNRSFGLGQKDITLYGLTYLQSVKDACTGGAMHIEPGLWVTQAVADTPTTYPPQPTPPEVLPAGAQIIARMGSIPHGNALLAQGIAETFVGNPTLATTTQIYGGSRFPSFNSTPFAAAAPAISAAGSNENDTAANTPVPPPFVGPLPPFQQYDITVAANAANPRTPYNTDPLSCPWTPDSTVDGVPIQDVINDPISILQAHIDKQVAEGYTFETTVLNVATQANIQFSTIRNEPTSPTVPANMVNGAGSIGNLLFLEGGEPAGAQGPNANTATVYATFWIETVKHDHRPSFMQLQYAQMVVLDFGILLPLPLPPGTPPPPPPPPGTPPPLVGWPHVSVATLKKSFG